MGGVWSHCHVDGWIGAIDYQLIDFAYISCSLVNILALLAWIRQRVIALGIGVVGTKIECTGCVVDWYGDGKIKLSIGNLLVSIRELVFEISEKLGTPIKCLCIISIGD